MPTARRSTIPGRVTTLAVLDGVPILDALQRADAEFAKAWWHWFFLGASPHAARVINADPLAWYRPDASSMGPENYADMVNAVLDPATVRAMIEDVRRPHGSVKPWCRLPIDSAVIDSGHHMAEEAPDQLADVLLEHLRR